CDRWIRGRSSCAKAPLSSARNCFILARGRARAFPLRGPPAVSYPDELSVRWMPRDWRSAHAVVNSCLGAKPIDGPHAIGLCIYGYDPAKDRKSTRLNSSHVAISYAVFCLKKKNQNITKRH